AAFTRNCAGVAGRIGALSLVIDGQMHVIHTYGPWRNRARVSIPLNCGDHRHGLLQLETPVADSVLTPRETEILQQAAQHVACAICLSETPFAERLGFTSLVDAPAPIAVDGRAPAPSTNRVARVPQSIH
ncbi:MAG: hypothetical protein WDZ49_07975, partial [Litorilinea sp.]